MMPAQNLTPRPQGIRRLASWWVAGLLACSAIGHAGPVPANDLAQGRALYESRCGGCHAVDANRVGPQHRNLIGRQAGRVPDFAYSPALQSSTVVWSAKTLDPWLSNPEALIPGQRMNYSVRSAEDRRLIIEYLGSEAVSARTGAPRAP